MSSLSAVGRSAAARKNDRVSLCSFAFSDGRRCRIPRSAGHPHLCSDHARKDSQARAADKLARDLSYFFSGEYLSACDLTAALGRLIVSVARGDIKPRSARTLAYLAQTLVQTIHLAQDEYINAFDTGGWRRAVRNSVKGNHDYLFPPAPKTEQRESPQPQPQPQPAPPSTPPQPVAPPSAVCHPERSEGSHPIPATQPAPSPRTPMPPTSAEFAQHALVGIQLGEKSSPPLTRLKSTHTRPPASVDSKPLT